MRATLRKTNEGYILESRSTAGVIRVRHHTLVAALHADPALRQLWRPVGNNARGAVGPDVLFVVPANEE